MSPIFFGITRSFWFGVVPALLVLADIAVALAQDGTVGPVADLIATITGCSADTATAILRGVGALAALIVAQQRSGSARPYTVRATKETLQ